MLFREIFVMYCVPPVNVPEGSGPPPVLVHPIWLKGSESAPLINEVGVLTCKVA